MALNGRKLAGNKKIDILFMSVNIFWPQGVVYHWPEAKLMHKVMCCEHLCNRLANQSQISYVAFLQRKNVAFLQREDDFLYK